jgi:hypothetical protein
MRPCTILTYRWSLHGGSPSGSLAKGLCMLVIRSEQMAALSPIRLFLRVLSLQNP